MFNCFKSQGDTLLFMKKMSLIILTAFAAASISCKVRNGCPGNGRNIGAERILSGEPKALKETKKAVKFKYNNLHR